jgi:hydrogenase-4 component F
MTTSALILIPAMAGLAAFFWNSHPGRRALLLSASGLHLALTLSLWARSGGSCFGGWLEADAVGVLFLTITSVLFFVVAVYTIGVNPGGGESGKGDPGKVFHGCLLSFLAAMTLVLVSQHLGLLWVGIEGTTLATAPLIYHHRHPRSLEAAWKYLVICSVGIALALLGTFFLAAAASATAGGSHSMLVSSLQARAAFLDPVWLKAAFIFLLAGYGTKMGLAPFHTWLPDAHSESPSAVSALLSGALLNCAFVGLLRANQICIAAGQGAFTGDLLILFGLISMGAAAVFMIGQTDYKRMLAYSSVEHVGILALGAGLGGAALFGSMLHAVNHSLAKGMLFMTAGNLLHAYGSKSILRVRGLLRTLPVSGLLWTAGFLALCGSPPFGLFLSEFTILKGALDAGRWTVAGIYLVLLTLVFIGMSSLVLPMVQGKPEADGENRPGHKKERLWTVLSPILLLVAILVLGLIVPGPLRALLEAAARVAGGRP